LRIWFEIRYKGRLEISGLRKAIIVSSAPAYDFAGAYIFAATFQAPEIRLEIVGWG
jgi:hypothetical protein